MVLSQYTPIQYLKGIGPKRAKALNKLGLHTIEDLLYYFPRRYEDRTYFIPISELKEGLTYTVKAKVLTKRERRSFKRHGFSIVEVTVGDDTGKMPCVWFNQPYLVKKYFKLGENLILYGRITRYAGRLQMNSPEFEIVSDESDKSLNMGRLVPIYSLPEELTQRSFRRIIKYSLDKYLTQIIDFLPYDIRSRNKLLNLAKSLINIHFPDNLKMQEEAYQRLAFEEFFLFQVLLTLRKLKRIEKRGLPKNIDPEFTKGFIDNLPFKLTKAQEKVIAEIKSDIESHKVMQRLLEGDVGSGKTIVATIASILAIGAGFQVAFMVPTEILARQHYEKISCQLSVISYQSKKIKVGLLTSGLDKDEKRKIYQEISEGKIDLLIGTHSLLEEEVKFKNLGLIVIDEQHKFGVSQRALLPQKGNNPDVLIMTATPIPRTLAITLYGDLDISVINELPPGRLAVKTLHFSQDQRNDAYDLVKQQLNLGHQAYIIHPVIEESFALDMQGVKNIYSQLKKNEFRQYRLGLIHGRLKQKQQDEIMLKFKDKKLDILIATTVLEVGIDVPNATCMVIEHAQHFGLAQLHQLRGRVGRAGFESFCLLISDCPTQEAMLRIKAMIDYSDGFRIAEEDLKIRGPGEFFGQRQSGLCELKIANPLTQMHTLKLAREEAIKLINKDQGLELRQNAQLKQKLWQRFPEYKKILANGICL